MNYNFLTHCIFNVAILIFVSPMRPVRAALPDSLSDTTYSWQLKQIDEWTQNRNGKSQAQDNSVWYQDELKKGTDYDLPTAQVSPSAAAGQKSENNPSNVNYSSATIGAQVELLPSRFIDHQKDRIPSFFAIHRIFKIVGKSKPESVLVQTDGTLKATASEIPFRYTRDDVHNSPYIFPSRDWKVKTLGWFAGDPDPEKAMRIVYRNDPSAKEKTCLIPDWGLTFHIWPFFFDSHSDNFYFLVTNGPTGYRYDILLQFNVRTGTLKEIGETWGNPRLSPDAKWILWFPGGMADLQGKHVYTSRLSIFNVETETSLQITDGNDADQFIKWADLK